MAKPFISYIFPTFNEGQTVDHLYDVMAKLLAKHSAKYTFEIIFINDGSHDDTLERLTALQKHDSRIVIINFARNFGHQLAVTAGLDEAKGDAAIIMDSDMQDPPQVSIELIRKWQTGYDVVYAQRRTRKDTLFKRLTANLFYRLLHSLAEIDIPRNTGDFRLLDRKVINALSEFPEHNRFIRGLVSYVGFRQAAVLFDRDERYAGETGYPLKKMIKFANDGIFGFSWVPLRLITKFGYTISALSFLGIIYAIGRKVIDPHTVVPGWTFIVIAVLFIGGIQLLMLGLVGNYVGRIYSESQNRPLYIVESVRRTKKHI